MAEEKRERLYQLPTGETTTDPNEYAAAWDRLIVAGARILGLEPLGCDPAVCFHTGVHTNPVAGFAPETIERLILLEERANMATLWAKKIKPPLPKEFAPAVKLYGEDEVRRLIDAACSLPIPEMEYIAYGEKKPVTDLKKRT